MLLRHNADRALKRILPWITLLSVGYMIYKIYAPFDADYIPPANISAMNQKWLQKEIFSYAIPEELPEPSPRVPNPQYGSFVRKVVQINHTNNALQSLINQGLNHHLIGKLKPLYNQLEAPFASVTVLYSNYVQPDGTQLAVNSRVLAVQTNKWAYYGKNTSQGYMFFDKDGNSPNSIMDRNPLNYERITSHFNPHRVHPISRRVRPHRGTDYKAPYGTPVKVTADGVVSFAGWQGGYGKIVIVSHRGGYETRYAHLSAINVNKGEQVSRGKVIGKLGNSGASTGAHLHYEVRVNGVAQNPLTVKLPSAYRLRQQDLPAWQEEIAAYQRAIEHLSINPVPSAGIGLQQVSHQK